MGFELRNGVVPTSLAGTRVLVEGKPIPVLYASRTQVNAILPYTLTPGQQASAHVEYNGVAGNELPPANVRPAAIAYFRLDGSPSRPAAALNEDGTINGPQNPAKASSRVVLFGTGGGVTNPPSTAGEVIPLEPRPLAQQITVRTDDNKELAVEYAGAAPGLIAGVVQVNVKLPDTLPANGQLRLKVGTSAALAFLDFVTIAVREK